MIHSPPVAGSLRLPKRKIIPASHHLGQFKTILRLCQRLRHKGSVFTYTASDLQSHINGTIAEIQEIALPFHQRVGEIPSSDPGNPRLFIKFSVILFLPDCIAFKINHFRMIHIVQQKIRGRKPVFFRQVKNVLRKRNELRYSPPFPKKQIFPVITVRVNPLSIVLPGRIGGKNCPVRLHIGQHHPQISLRVIKIAFLAGINSQSNHCIVVDNIVTTRRSFCIFSIFIAVNSFGQIHLSRFCICRFSEKICTLHQARCDRPAVIGRMKSSAQQPLRRPSGNGRKLFINLRLLLIPFFFPQIMQTGQHSLQIECRIRRRMEITVDQIKQTVLMLVSFHEIQSCQNPVSHLLIMIIYAVLIAVSRCHGGKQMDRILYVKQSISIRESPVIPALRIHVLKAQRPSYFFVVICCHFPVMSSHSL